MTEEMMKLFLDELHQLNENMSAMVQILDEKQKETIRREIDRRQTEIERLKGQVMQAEAAAKFHSEMFRVRTEDVK